MVDYLNFILSNYGFIALFLLMFAEHLFPPIPSEIILPLAGYNLALGHGNTWTYLSLATLGSFLGTTAWYLVGLKLGEKRLKNWTSRHGRWTGLTTRDIERSSRLFKKHGGSALFFSRLIPTLRTYISVPAGLHLYPFWKYSIYTLLGTIFWNSILLTLGYTLKTNFQEVSDWLGPVSYFVVGSLLLLYAFRLLSPSKSY